MLLALMTGACLGMVGLGLLRSARANLQWDFESAPLLGMPPSANARAASNIVAFPREARSARRGSLALHRHGLVSGRPGDYPGHPRPLAIHRQHVAGSRRR
jgi:hypothetical protein